MMRIGLSILLVLGTSVTFVCAKVIDEYNVRRDGHFIQVAALSKEYNIEKTINKLSQYDLYIQKYKNLKRIYIVNIDNKSVLSKIKKLYPNAFFAKTPDFEIVKDVIVEDSTQEIGQFEIIGDTKISDIELVDEDIELKVYEIDTENIIDNSSKPDTMNSNTILKTRKSFL